MATIFSRIVAGEIPNPCFYTQLTPPTSGLREDPGGGGTFKKKKKKQQRE